MTSPSKRAFEASSGWTWVAVAVGDRLTCGTTRSWLTPGRLHVVLRTRPAPARSRGREEQWIWFRCFTLVFWISREHPPASDISTSRP